MRSKIRVYRVFMVRSILSDDVFLLTQKNTRENYTLSLSLSLSDAKEGRKKRGHHTVAAFSVVSFSLFEE